jgi:glycine/D-amino acid oxidase-like deaminating enzyme
VRLETPRGAVQARRAILATNAYTRRLAPAVGRRFLPLYDYVLASEPLSDAQWEALGWRHRRGVTDGRTFFNYYRPTRDRRIVWGTSEALYFAGDRVGRDCDHSTAHYESLRASFRRHFPQLGEVDFPFAWGGPIASTTRFTPFFGTLAGGRVLYGLGYTGHGVGTTRIAGKILAHLALSRPSDLLSLSLVTRPPLPFPPRPLRAWAIGRVTRDLRRVDAGAAPSLLLRLLDRLGIGFSS